jgi:hypothetical protein
MERWKAALGEWGGMGLPPQCDCGVNPGEAAPATGLTRLLPRADDVKTHNQPAEVVAHRVGDCPRPCR